MSKKLLNQKKENTYSIQYIYIYMFQVFGPPLPPAHGHGIPPTPLVDVGWGGRWLCMQCVHGIPLPCCVGWGGKGVAYAVSENYNS